MAVWCLRLCGCKVDAVRYGRVAAWNKCQLLASMHGLENKPGVNIFTFIYT